MIRMFKELKGSYRYVLIIVVLLFLQAYCDLSLPSYTSDIINVGVQQGGIADSVPDEIRRSSMEQLMLFMDTEDQETVKERQQKVLGHGGPYKSPSEDPGFEGMKLRLKAMGGQNAV